MQQHLNITRFWEDFPGLGGHSRRTCRLRTSSILYCFIGENFLCSTGVPNSRRLLLTSAYLRLAQSFNKYLTTGRRITRFVDFLRKTNAGSAWRVSWARSCTCSRVRSQFCCWTGTWPLRDVTHSNLIKKRICFIHQDSNVRISNLSRNKFTFWIVERILEKIN